MSRIWNERGTNAMRHYLYVTDPEGNEIAGSRRSIDHCERPGDVGKLTAELEAMIGEGCTVEDNVDDWHDYWKARGID